MLLLVSNYGRISNGFFGYYLSLFIVGTCMWLRSESESGILSKRFVTIHSGFSNNRSQHIKTQYASVNMWAILHMNHYLYHTSHIFNAMFWMPGNLADVCLIYIVDIQPLSLKSTKTRFCRNPNAYSTLYFDYISIPPKSAIQNSLQKSSDSPRM